MSRALAIVLLAAAVASGCASVPKSALTPSASPTLREAYADAFLVGVAINEAQARGQDARGNPIIEAHFNSLTPENVLKWESVHPERGVYDFDAADAFVAYGEANGQFIVGHALVWHEQTGGWVFEHPDGSPLSRDELLAVMEDHISTVVGRYRGRIDAWDVVNEALADDGSLRESKWLQIIGPDFVEHAFRFAHAADPDAELYYNDYGLEKPEKRAGAVRLLQRLVNAGVPLAGVGVQTHMWMDWPTVPEMEAQILDLAPFGPVMITELDIGVLKDFAGPDDATSEISARGAEVVGSDPYTDGLPADVQRQLAARYTESFALYYRLRDVISRVTFWGVTDGDSWRNGWPYPGRTNYPLLFDRDGQPKPAFDAVIGVAEE